MLSVTNASGFGSGGPSAYAITNSCTFNGSDEYLVRTWSASPTANDVWSLSTWIERDGIGVLEGWFGADIQASRNSSIKFQADNQIEVYNDNASQTIDRASTETVGTDWVHILCTFDVAAAGNPINIYLDGSEVSYSYTLDQGSTGYSMNHASTIHRVGATYHSSTFFNGALAEVVFIDGLVVGIGSFYDSGSPVDPSGLTFGDDGFHLNFKDSSDMGNDASGNGNDFTLTNIDSGNQSTNVP